MADSFKTVTVQLASTTAEVYSAPTAPSTKGNVLKATVNNSSAAVVTFTVTMTVSGGTALELISQQTVGAKKWFNFTAAFTGSLDAGDSINMYASTAAVMNMKMRILESA